MNMDEFLNTIWTAEENEARSQNANPIVPTAEASTIHNNMNRQYHIGQTQNESSDIARQMSLTRQRSLGVPAPSCQKTAEEVWSEIRRPQQSTSNIPHASSRPREPSYGEMTFQEFLVKVGVFREEGADVSQIPPPLPQYQFQPRPAPLVSQPPLAGPLLPQPQLPYGSVGVPTPLEPQATNFYGVASGVGGSENFGEMGAVSLDRIGLNNLGRKRMIEGPSEMMIERYEKRLIRNRKAATRSRAKEQAYTRELEAELNQLKRENACLAQRLQFKAMEKAKKKRGTLRRTLSCPY